MPNTHLEDGLSVHAQLSEAFGAVGVRLFEQARVDGGRTYVRAGRGVGGRASQLKARGKWMRSAAVWHVSSLSIVDHRSSSGAYDV